MKIFNLLFVSGVVLLIVILALIEVQDAFSEDTLFEEQRYKQLTSIVDSKAERVQDFLNSRKADAVFLAESEDAKNAFDNKLIQDVELISGKIKNIAEDTAKDIEEYLLKHPDMTLEDLQNNEEFKSIAVRDVGTTGYSFLYDVDTQINILHKEPERIGYNYSSLSSQFEDLRKILYEAKDEDSYGFYSRLEPDGVIREKYMYVSKIDSGEFSLAVGASTYLDEYGKTMTLAGNLDKELKLFQEAKGYSDLILINPEGDVVWSSEKNDELGTNLETGIYNEDLLSDMFRSAKNNLKVEFSESNFYRKGILQFFLTSPVFKTDKISGKEIFIGVVALKLDDRKIVNLIASDSGLGENGEVYIVNRDRSHITPLKFDETKTLEEAHHIINSERIDRCFKDYDNYYLALKGEYTENIERVGTEPNYLGEDVIGTYYYILESEWCVIAEMKEEDFDYIGRTIYAVILISFIISILIIFILNRLYIIKIRRKNK